MEFRRGGERQAVWLAPRSLLVMAGPARYSWHHYIPHRKVDQVQGRSVPRSPRRMSFTFRQVILAYMRGNRLCFALRVFGLASWASVGSINSHVQVTCPRQVWLLFLKCSCAASCWD